MNPSTVDILLALSNIGANALAGYLHSTGQRMPTDAQGREIAHRALPALRELLKRRGQTSAREIMEIVTTIFVAAWLAATGLHRPRARA